MSKTTDTQTKVSNGADTPLAFAPVLPTVFPCKKIRSGKYEYRGWIISRVGYYEPERRVCWEAVDPETNCGDFHGFSKKEIKWLIDDYLSRNGG